MKETSDAASFSVWKRKGQKFEAFGQSRRCHCRPRKVNHAVLQVASDNISPLHSCPEIVKLRNSVEPCFQSSQLGSGLIKEHWFFKNCNSGCRARCGWRASYVMASCIFNSASFFSSPFCEDRFFRRMPRRPPPQWPLRRTMNATTTMLMMSTMKAKTQAATMISTGMSSSKELLSWIRSTGPSAAGSENHQSSKDSEMKTSGHDKFNSKSWKAV